MPVKSQLFTPKFNVGSRQLGKDNMEYIRNVSMEYVRIEYVRIEYYEEHVVFVSNQIYY